MKEGCEWQNGMKLSLLRSHASVCNTTMVRFESGTPWREDVNTCVMHRHTGPALGMMVWGGIGYRSRTPLVRIAVAFYQRSSSSRLIEDETFNDSGIINNLIDFKDGQGELDSLRADTNMHRDPAFQQNGKAFS
ncbi:transposable element Tcb1 transposase [Trichonephila clavipes]|nr:transposable element Tcb1 transposase [Trichonephila clavipes]